MAFDPEKLTGIVDSLRAMNDYFVSLKSLSVPTLPPEGMDAKDEQFALRQFATDAVDFFQQLTSVDVPNDTDFFQLNDSLGEIESELSRTRQGNFTVDGAVDSVEVGYTSINIILPKPKGGGDDTPTASASAELIKVDKHYWVYTEDATRTETVDSDNWLGREIWYTIATTDYESGAVDEGGPDDPAYGGHLMPRAHCSGHDSTGVDNEITLDAVTTGAGESLASARLYIDDADTGKLKVEFTGGGLGNGANWRISAIGWARLTSDDYIQVTD